MTPTPAAPAADPRVLAEDALYRLRRVERSLVAVTNVLMAHHEDRPGQPASLHLVQAGDLAFLLELASDQITQALTPLESAVAAAISCSFNRSAT